MKTISEFQQEIRTMQVERGELSEEDKYGEYWDYYE